MERAFKPIISTMLAVAAAIILSLGWSASAFAQSAAEAGANPPPSSLTEMFGPAAQVTAGEGLDNLTPNIRFARDFRGNLTTENLQSFAADAEFEQSDITNYGGPGTRFLLTIAVTNTGEEAGDWRLFTKRAGLPELTFAELRGDRIEILRDRGDTDLGEHLRTYHGFAHPFELGSGETRYFVVAFTGVHSSSLPLLIADPAAAMQRQNFRLATIVASAASMLVLMLVATLFYLVTAGRHYLWLAIAELNHAAFVIHVNGYSIHYWLHDKGIWIYSIGWIMPCLYGLAMVQFTRGLLDTSQTLPRLDRLLSWLAISLAATLALIVVAAVSSSEWLLGLAGYPVPVSLTLYTFGLPIVGAIAVARLGKQYLPLLLAWALMAVFSGYFTIALLDIGVTLPFDAYSYGPIGVVVSLLLTLAMVLHMRKIMQDKQQSETDLIASLEDRLQLSEEKANALATIKDQDHLMHASGHDSQQVMLALNAIVQYVEADEAGGVASELPATLRASINQLQDIVSTTMSGPFASGENSSAILLGQFKLRDLLRQLEMIYRPLAHRKRLVLTIDAADDLHVITDRAMLARVLSNLLNNAVKFTDTGSINLRVTREGEQLGLALRDTGCGMDADFVGNLFDATNSRQKRDENSEGTGSGLHSSLGILEKLGASIDIESEIDAGTLILMKLPLMAAEETCVFDMFAEQAQAAGLSLIDMDSQGDPAGDGELRDQNAITIPGTIDPTATMRARMAGIGPVALLKPLNPAMLGHPAVAALKVQVSTK